VPILQTFSAIINRVTISLVMDFWVAIHGIWDVPDSMLQIKRGDMVNVVVRE